jgi:hypothetical protein
MKRAVWEVVQDLEDEGLEVSAQTSHSSSCCLWLMGGDNIWQNWWIWLLLNGICIRFTDFFEIFRVEHGREEVHQVLHQAVTALLE